MPSNDMPMVERMWRQYRKSEIWQSIRRAAVAPARLEALAASLAIEIDALRLTPTVTAVSDVIYETFAGDREQAEEARMGLSWHIPAMEHYSHHKRIYRFSSQVANALLAAKAPDNLPLGAVRAPVSGAAIVMRGVQGVRIAGKPATDLEFVVTEDFFPNGSRRVVVAGWANTSTIDVVTGIGHWLIDGSSTLRDLKAETFKGHGDTEIRASKQLLDLCVNAILFIAGNDDVVGQVDAIERPEPKTDSQKRKWELRDPTILTVGEKFERALNHSLRTYEQDSGGLDPDRERKPSPRPHIRGAHTHLYWTGKGRTEPRVLFLPPIPVLGGKAKHPARHTTINVNRVEVAQ